MTALKNWIELYHLYSYSRAVTRKGGVGNELVGMVKEGTACGSNKVMPAFEYLRVISLIFARFLRDAKVASLD